MPTPPIHEELPEIRKTARRATWLTLISGVVVLGSLGYSAYQISSLDRTLEDRHAALEKLAADIDQKQATANELETRLHDLNAAIKMIPQKQFEQAVEKTASTLRPRVYIHIANESQRPEAEKVAAALKAAGYDVPGIEYVGKRSPRPTQVRYFVRSAESISDVQGVMKVLKELGVDARDQFVSLPSSAARARHLELWFGAGNDPKAAY